MSAGTMISASLMACPFVPFSPPTFPACADRNPRRWAADESGELFATR
ncbi:Uncharacterised protein [Mycobacteroides abscessus subsp. abscessus]|nr:Uncharacterised protein [Mycobacteroides abscessus subsp. abscessus]